MYCVILVVFSHLALVSLIDLKHTDNVSNTQCSAQLKFLSRHSLQKWRFFFLKGKINQYIKIITISITTAQIMNPSALSSTEHKNFIYNDLIVYAFIISW